MNKFLWILVVAAIIIGGVCMFFAPGLRAQDSYETVCPTVKSISMKLDRLEIEFLKRFMTVKQRNTWQQCGGG